MEGGISNGGPPPELWDSFCSRPAFACSHSSFPFRKREASSVSENDVHSSPCTAGPFGFPVEICSFFRSYYSWHILLVDFVCMQSLKNSSADLSNLPSERE